MDVQMLILILVLGIMWMFNSHVPLSANSKMIVNVIVTALLFLWLVWLLLRVFNFV